MSRHHIMNVIPGSKAIRPHIGLLLQGLREARAGRRRDEDAYVWWGIRTLVNQPAAASMRSAMLALPTETRRDDPGPETHLYLTDYHSVFVAHLGGISEESPWGRADQKRNLPPPIGGAAGREQRKSDIWVRLWDIRCLVPNDVTLVDHELRKLVDVQRGSPISIFDGVAGPALIVKPADERRIVRYFDSDFRDRYTDGEHWTEFESRLGGVATMERELHENLFGDTVWRELSAAERLFLATAEKLFRDTSHEVMFDFGAILAEYAKVLELRCRHVLAAVFAKRPERLRKWKRGEKLVDVTTPNSGIGLKQIAEFITDVDRARVLREATNGTWFTKVFPDTLRKLTELRNSAVHGRVIVDRSRVAELRAAICGIGCKGLIVDLVEVRPK